MAAKQSQIVEFINQSPQRSVFCYPWWLDAVTDGNYSYVLSTKGNEIRGVLPIWHKKKLGMDICTMPPFTQILGALLSEMQGKYVTRLSREHKYLDQLIQQLPEARYYNIRLHHTLSNWLPFYWNGFQQTTRYTYVLPEISDPDKVWNGMRPNIRREIRKAEDQVEVSEEDDIELLIRLRNMTYERQDKTPAHSARKIRRIYQAGSENNRCQLFFARDAGHRVHSGLLLVWDDRTAYYLIGGSDPELRTSGAASLVMWEAVRFAARFVSRFNFEGSMVQSIERFFRGFGGQQVPYSAVTKFNPEFLRFIRIFRQDI